MARISFLLLLIGLGIGCQVETPRFHEHDAAGAACEGPDDCPGDQPFCVEGTCAECETSMDCAAAEPVCSADVHACGACEAEPDCEDRAETLHCLDISGACVACRDNDDCDAAAPVCAGNVCRTCLDDDDCASDVCDPAGTCVDPADVIYVSTTGSASGTCTQGSPCSTFTYALTQVAGTRSTILAAPGTYIEDLAVNTGTVRILGEGAILQSATAGNTVVDISGGADLALEGFEITGASGSGEAGVSCNSTTATVRLYRTHIWGNTGGVSITGCRFSLINNLIRANGNPVSSYGGVSITSIVGGGVHELAFNTITANLGAMNSVNGVACYTISPVLTFTSNIVYDNQVSGSGTQVGDDTECHWSYSDIGPQGVFGTGNINADPMFVNVGAADLHLMTGSPAKNVGDPAATEAFDWDGDLRPMGIARDMGADEFVE